MAPGAAADMSQAALRFCKYLGKCAFEDLRSASSAVLLIKRE